VFHVKIIQAQMAADLKNGQTDIYSREWLGAACTDLASEIERAIVDARAIWIAGYTALANNRAFRCARG
jgi:hypothetical protein